MFRWQYCHRAYKRRNKNEKDHNGFNDFFYGVLYVAFELSSESALYAVCSVENGRHTNEWLGISFDVSDTYPESDESACADFENEYMDCGYASQNTETGQQFILFFSDTSEFKQQTTDEFVNEYIVQIKTTYEHLGVTADFSDISDIKIADADYRYVKVHSLTNGNYQFFCFRKIGKRFCTFLAIDNSEEKVIEALGRVTAL